MRTFHLTASFWKLLITMVPCSFTKFEKQFSTKVAWVQPFIRDEIIDGVNILQGCNKLSNQQTISMPIVTVQSLKCQPMEKLHNVLCMQFSFSNDNTLLSESVEWAVKVIADSVDSAFLTIIIWENPCIQAAIVIWVESEATSWVKTHGRYQGTSPPLEILAEEEW